MLGVVGNAATILSIKVYSATLAFRVAPGKKGGQSEIQMAVIKSTDRGGREPGLPRPRKNSSVINGRALITRGEGPVAVSQVGCRAPIPNKRLPMLRSSGRNFYAAAVAGGAVELNVCLLAEFEFSGAGLEGGGAFRNERQS